MTVVFLVWQGPWGSCGCVWKALRLKCRDLEALKERGANAVWGAACENAGYLAAICDLKLRFSATTGGRGAIWEIA